MKGFSTWSLQGQAVSKYKMKSQASILEFIDPIYQIEGLLLFVTHWTSWPLHAGFLWQYDLSDLSSLLWNVGDKNGGEPDDAELVRLSKRLVENAVLKAVQQYLEETQNKNKPGDGSSVKAEEADRNGTDSDDRKWDPHAGRTPLPREKHPCPPLPSQGTHCIVLSKCLVQSVKIA